MRAMVLTDRCRGWSAESLGGTARPADAGHRIAGDVGLQRLFDGGDQVGIFFRGWAAATAARRGQLLGLGLVGRRTSAQSTTCCRWAWCGRSAAPQLSGGSACAPARACAGHSKKNAVSDVLGLTRSATPGSGRCPTLPRSFSYPRTVPFSRPASPDLTRNHPNTANGPATGLQRAAEIRVYHGRDGSPHDDAATSRNPDGVV